MPTILEVWSHYLNLVFVLKHMLRMSEDIPILHANDKTI